MFTSFAFPFANFFQPGIFWPGLADYRPLQIIALAALFASLGRTASYPRLQAVKHPAIKWLLFFLFVQAISVYRTGMSGVLAEFNFWLTYALFVLVSIRIVTDPKALRRYIWGMMCGSIWIVGWGIYAVHAGIETSNGGRAGAYGMYENHNDYSFIIVQALPFFYMYFRGETGFLRRGFLLASMVACAVGILLSLSRGGMIALVLEAVLIVMLTMKPRTRLMLLPLVLAVGAMAVSYQYLKRAENQGDDYTAEDAETSRYELWDAGAGMIKHHPFLGIGSRSFGEHATEYGEISHDNLGKNAHNTFIEVTATTGFIGLAAFVMMLVGAVRELRSPLPGASTWEADTRKATLIALYTICFRAMFDAKSWDWSFYVLISIAVIGGVMARARAPADSLADPLQGPLAEPPPFSNRLA